MKINVPEKYADLYLKALTERRQALERKIDDFVKEIEDINNHISALTSMPIFHENMPHTIVQWETEGYRPEWSWTKKINYYQDIRQKLMTSQEVIDYILEKEPNLNKTKVRSSISAALSNYCKSEKYVKFVESITNTTYYGLPGWFDHRHQPLLPFVPDEVKQRLKAT